MGDYFVAMAYILNIAALLLCVIIPEKFTGLKFVSIKDPAMKPPVKLLPPKKYPSFVVRLSPFVLKYVSVATNNVKKMKDIIINIFLLPPVNLFFEIT